MSFGIPVRNGLGVGLLASTTLSTRRGGTPFSPTSLFAAGEQGYWLDPSDFSTMFQDAAGATPVTATGQSVRRILDKSGRGNHFTQANTANAPILGVEPFGGRRNVLTFTEQFDNAAWAKINATVTANAGTAPDGTTTADALFETVTNGVHQTQQAQTIVSGSTYTFSAYVKANGRTRGAIFLARNASPFDGFNVIFDLTAVSVTTSVNGTGTITNSGIVSVGSGWFRVFGTGTAGTFTAVNAGIQARNDAGASSYVGDPTRGLHIWGAQLELGSTATAYQRVTDQWNVTQAGVADCYYLAFDGTDDWLQSVATINPGAADKAQVFAGVRKLSDAALGVLVEASSNAGANNGAFNIGAPASAAANYSFASRGSATATATASSTFAAPITSVLAGIGDIAADTCVLRANGTQVAASATDQGTGNYLTYSHFIARRNGTTSPYNGRVYQMVMRFGPNLTAGQITQTETFVNSKTGAY